MATEAKTDLYELAKDVLATLNEKEEAAPLLGAYDTRIQFNVTDGDSFYAVLEGGRLQSVERGDCEGFSNREDIELFGQEEALRMVLEGRMSPATAMYYGKLTPRGERAKHSQVAVTYTLLRIAQEQPVEMVTSP